MDKNLALDYNHITDNDLVKVGFVCQQGEPTDMELENMLDDLIYKTLGPNGFSEIVKPGNKVVIKVNMVGPSIGTRGEKGRGVITDPRIVRYVAEKVRDIIGDEGSADLKVVDALFYDDKNPSLKTDKGSFYWARLEKGGNNTIDEDDYCYDMNADGILDGKSKAKLINLDSLTEDQYEEYKVKVESGIEITLCFPKFLRRREEAEGSEEYCDVLIGLPILKNHLMAGMTGALKLHYGFRNYKGIKGDRGRFGHNGFIMATLPEVSEVGNLMDYFCAQHCVRTYDFVIMDCITGNTSGPLTTQFGGLMHMNYDTPVNYIFTNALLASRDSVAIDTLEAVLGGYKPESIPLIKEAALNGIGSNVISKIDLTDLDCFSTHRALLYDLYNQQGMYPFPNGYGDAVVLPEIKANYTVSINKKQIGEGKYQVEYQVGSKTRHLTKLSRVELWINRQRLDYEINGDLSNGMFTFDITLAGLQRNSSFDLAIAVWDDKFNCVCANSYDIG